MRHLHFTQSLEPLQGGGLGRAALDLHLQLLQDGLYSRLVATRAPDFDGNWPETRQYLRSGPPKIFFSDKLGREAGKLIDGIDVIHGHGFYVFPNWAIGSRAISRQKSLVYHPQGMFEPWILRRSRWKKRLVSVLFESRNMKRCRLWRALTNREADQIQRQGFKAPIIVAPNGVRLEEFDDYAMGSSTLPALPERVMQKRKLLFMARLHPKKGLDLLVPAWAKLKEFHTSWELLIAGPDEDGYRAAVESMISKLEVALATTILGAVTGSRKRELLKRSDVFILPSYSEGFSVAVLEAMTCRVPVIGTDGCNFAELETEGGGWLCNANVDSVQKSLEAALLSSDEELKERGRAARKLIERKYTWANITSTIRDGCACHCS